MSSVLNTELFKRGYRLIVKIVNDCTVKLYNINNQNIMFFICIITLYNKATVILRNFDF